MSHSLKPSSSLSRVPSLEKVPSLARVPSFEELPTPIVPKDVELDHISIDSEPNTLSNNTEIQIAYEEQRQHYEVEHVHDSHKVCIRERTFYFLLFILSPISTVMPLLLSSSF